MTERQWWELLDQHYSWLLRWVHKWGTEDAMTRFCHGAKLRTGLGREMVMTALVNAYWRNPLREPVQAASHDRAGYTALLELYNWGLQDRGDS